MTNSVSKGFRVLQAREATTVPCSCGSSARILNRADGAACNLHVTAIRDSVLHYHKHCTEVYYILEGKGKMELNATVVDVEPGTVVYIEPYTRHRLWSEQGVKTIVAGFPAWDPADEHYD
ncbi:MAG: cupin domain-containing protein [Gemmataceae bacterium]|nr:cupin domain-containing protein [Gemmataceae bacterium]